MGLGGMTLSVSAGLGSTATSGVESPSLITNTKSILFDGSDEYINLGSDFKSITQGGTRTICAWIKAGSTDPTDENNRGRIFSMYRANDSTSFGIHAEGASAPANWYYMYRSTGDSFNSVDSGVNITTSWTHLALTQNGANLKFYINGVEEDSKTDATYVWSATRPAIIGGHLTASAQSQEFNGNIDEVGLWNSELSATEIEAIADNKRLDFTKNSVGYASSSNLAGWWRMGDEADTRVADSDTNNLIVPDMRKTFFTSKSIDFDGSDDYIVVNETFESTNFSISFWVKAVNLTDDVYLFDQNAGTARGVILGYQNNNINFYGKESGESAKYPTGSAADTQFSISADTWHHIVMMTDGSKVYAYKDEVKVVEETGTWGADGAEKLWIGQYESGNNFEGQIADVAIWDTVLSAADISDIYNSGEPTDLTLAASYDSDKTSNLQGYWRMGNASDDSHPTIQDQTSNNNDGTMTNMSQYDIVEHAPNRHSGDMIGFDVTSDIEDDVKT